MKNMPCSVEPMNSMRQNFIFHQKQGYCRTKLPASSLPCKNEVKQMSPYSAVHRAENQNLLKCGAIGDCREGKIDANLPTLQLTGELKKMWI